MAKRAVIWNFSSRSRRAGQFIYCHSFEHLPLACHQNLHFFPGRRNETALPADQIVIPFIALRGGLANTDESVVPYLQPVHHFVQIPKILEGVCKALVIFRGDAPEEYPAQTADPLLCSSPPS